MNTVRAKNFPVRESIVPNGSFILGTDIGWKTTSNHICSPSFLVIPGRSYLLHFELSSSQPVSLRIAYQDRREDNILPFDNGMQGFMFDEQISDEPTIYEYDWTCPKTLKGPQYASLSVFSKALVTVGVKSFQCFPAVTPYEAHITPQGDIV